MIMHFLYTIIVDLIMLAYHCQDGSNIMLYDSVTFVKTTYSSKKSNSSDLNKIIRNKTKSLSFNKTKSLSSKN